MLPINSYSLPKRYMKFTHFLIPGILIQRYKRFLADVTTVGGITVTASCQNTGSMLGLTKPGSKVWLSESDSLTRKYRHAWEMIEANLGTGPYLVGVNTMWPNVLVTEAIQNGMIAELSGYAMLRREVKYGLNSRIDVFLSGRWDQRDCYVEVKNVHLMREIGLAEFPDSKTERGVKHLHELASMVAKGYRAVIVFLVQRSDAKNFKLARDIDCAYAAAFHTAAASGVEMLCYKCQLSPTEIIVEKRIEIADL